VVSQYSEVDVQALAYLVTVVIHRLQETDRLWWNEFLDEIKADRNSSPAGSARDKILSKAISIVDQALAQEPDTSESNPQPARVKDGS
jgi:hypothetical protein